MAVSGFKRACDGRFELSSCAPFKISSFRFGLNLRSVLITLLAAGWMGAAQSQTTVFSENIGTPTGTTTLAAYATGTAPATFQNKGTLTYGQGEQTSPADVRSTSVSSVYTGSSGGGNVYFTSTSGAYGFSIESINASTYTSLQLTYGYRKESASALPTVSVDYWNGTAWITVANASTTLFNEAANASSAWYLAKTLSLPADAQINGLKIRFVKSGAVAFRIDDIKLTGTLASIPKITLSTNSLNLGSTFTDSASTPVSYTVSGTNLGSNNVAVTPNSSLIEISTNASSGFATNALTLTQTGGVVSNTVYVRIGTNSTATNISSTISHVSGSASTNLTVSGTISQAGQPPVVTSTNFLGQVNVFFSNAISASGSPTNFTLVSGTLPGGLTFNSNNGTITGTPTNATVGTNNLTVTAANTNGTSSNTIIGLAIAKGDQTITFTNNLAGLAVGSTNALTATANSQLSVTYTSSATNVATISGSSVVAVGAGSATITARQAGDDNWNAATDVLQTLTVYPSGMAYWNFNTDTPTVVPSGWTIGAVSQGNNNGTTTMLSSSSATNAVVYSNAFGVAASLSTNAQAAARIGAINTGTSGSAYFEFTVTAPLSSTNLAITNIFFGYRSTSTGPQGYSIRSSADNYAADIPGGSGALANNSTWAAVSAPVSVLMTNGQNTTFRIYGRDGTGSPSSGSANWRIDDLTLAIGALELNQPSLTLTPSSLSGLSTFNGTPSAGTSYVINGSNLTNQVTVTPSSTVLEVSSNNINFTNTLNISPSLGSVSNTTLYVRISGTAGQGALTGAYVRHVSTGLTNDLAVAGNVYDATRGASSNSLIGWDASGQTNYGVSPWAPAVSASNLTISSNLTRGSGVLTTGTAAGRGWGGVDWSSPDVDTAVSSNKVVSFTIAANTGYKLSLSSISKLDYRRPSSGPTSGVVQVQIGSGSFSNVAALSFPGTNSAGESLAAAIDLSTNPTLQNIPANTQVTLRIVNFGGANTSGTWYIYDKDNNPNLDFEVTGNVDVASATPPTITSTNAYSGTVGVAFSNTITATGSVPIAFSGTGLPGGLSVATVATNGVISGTPTAAGTFTNAVLTATNAAGTNNQAATFTIAKGTPTISVLPTASDINLGQTLASSSLTGGSASVGGTFSFTDSSVIPTEGTYSASVTFTPNDTVNYNTVITNVNVTVMTSTPTDTTPPVITLNGFHINAVAWGSSYSDAGATATDNLDGPVSVSTSGAVNTAKPGTYTITYSAKDAANNEATATRTVTVQAPSSVVGPDGLSPLMRYAFGANGPNDPVTKPTFAIVDGKLVVTAIVRTDNNKLDVFGQAVTNLANYGSGSEIKVDGSSQNVDQSGLPDGCARKTFSVSQGSDVKKFMRLVVNLAP